MIGKLRKYSAESIGTFALVFTRLMGIEISSQFASSLSILIVPIVFGSVIMVMIYAIGHISGAHFNPDERVSILTQILSCDLPASHPYKNGI